MCAVGVNREAVRLSQLQADFVLNVSHQLRTPLAMLSGAAETLGLERLRSPEKIKALRRHRAGADRGVCRRSSTRSSTPTPPTIRRRPSRGSASISGRWWRAPRPTSSSSPIAVAVAIAVDRQPGAVLVDGDPVALEHVILNLLENAVKYGADARQRGAGRTSGPPAGRQS